MICNQKQGNDCVAFFTENKVGPVGTAALGARFRFFMQQPRHSQLEVRDYAYLDSYYENVNRAAALNAANPTGDGNLASNPGITNLGAVDLGYTYLF